ncbi:AMP-binding protein [Nonomuraea typhae]|uniref:AMP-binding protein n=1 Tax=Nonomuraea typhae TaxID=2603600 RepID=UPI001CA51D80|nr:AMP-binding protein [Nonomuraea typhae]
MARTALARPNAPALVSGQTTITYGELHRTADAWAARLIDAGVAKGHCVPILLPRSTDLVIALLAVLKTGAAYALLDSAWPAHRLAEVVADLGAELIVCAAGAADLGARAWSPPGGPVPVPDGYRPVAVGGRDPATVFLTSGGTGRPRCVLTPHAATARLFQHDGFARFGAHTVMPLAAPLPWDAFSLELWSVLLNGGTSLIVDEPHLTAAGLRGAVENHGTDIVWLTGSRFNMIVDEDLDAFQGLRQVMIGGERLSAGHVARFVARHPVIVLLNGYGPVESTVFATTHRVTAADCERPGGIPLGRPVPGTQIHVLDGARPCAVGETGEICIAGAGLAIGYLGDAELTAVRFTHVRLDGRRVRVYRTGDLGAWDQDGVLHLRGRRGRAGGRRAVVSVPAVPFTERGKPGEPLPHRAGEHAGELVAQTFTEILGRADRPFTELGAGPHVAGRICARLSERLGRPVPISRLYQHPTAAGLTAWLETTDGTTPATSDVTLLTPAQTALLTNPRGRAAHRLLTWIIDGDLDPAALESAVAAVHRAHDPLRAAYLLRPKPAAWSSPDVPPPPLEVLPPSPDRAAALSALRLALSAPLNPAEGEVWHAALAPAGKDRAVFGLAVHAIALEGWPERELAADLAAAYNHGRLTSRRRPRPVTAEPVAGLLAEPSGVPRLSWPGEPDPDAGGPRHLETPLPPAVMAHVDTLAARARACRLSVLLALCASNLAEVTGSRDLAVGLPAPQEYGPAAGCHAHLLGVRLRGRALAGDPVAVRETGTAVARAMAGGGVPFPEAAGPLCQVVFALRDTLPPGLPLAGLRTAYARQPYLELTAELHAETWPRADGGMDLVVSYDPRIVPGAAAEEFAKRFADRLRTPGDHALL